MKASESSEFLSPRKSILIVVGVEAWPDVWKEIEQKVGNITIDNAIYFSDYTRSHPTEEAEKMMIEDVQNQVRAGNYQHATIAYHKETSYATELIHLALSLAKNPDLGINAVVVQGGWAGHIKHPETVRRIISGPNT